MSEMSLITAMPSTDLSGNVIVKRINIIHFDLLERFYYILNLPRISKLFCFFGKIYVQCQKCLSQTLEWWH